MKLGGLQNSQQKGQPKYLSGIHIIDIACNNNDEYRLNNDFVEQASCKKGHDEHFNTNIKIIFVVKELFEKMDRKYNVCGCALIYWEFIYLFPRQIN